MASSVSQGQAIRRQIIHVGMDFGTAYSSISYVIPDPFGQVEPGRSQVHFSKVYLSEGNMVQTRIPKGDYTENDYEGGWIKWFKLSLLHPDDLPKGVRVLNTLDISTKEREALDLSATDAAAMYFKDLLGQFLGALSLGLGHEELARYDVEITVAVPDKWPVDARRRLHHALQPTIAAHANVRLARKFVPEGEATAIALLSDASRRGNFRGQGFEEADTVIICDCGGGTTVGFNLPTSISVHDAHLLKDSIAYKVTSTQPLTVEEISPGKCIFAGAVLVDEAFLQLVKDKTKTALPRRTFNTLTDSDFQDFVDEIWEQRIKVRHSIGAPRRDFSLPHKFLGSRANRAKMSFSVDDINSVFDPTVDKILNLLESEIAEVRRATGNGPKHVVVAGGFGRSRYLQLKIAQKVESLSPSTLTDWYTDEDGWTSVSRGAVLHAVQAHMRSIEPIVQIEGRASGESYGVDRRTDGSMHWLIRQGEVLSTTGPNRRALPSDALRRDTNGRVFVNMYRQREPDARVELFDCIVLTAVGEPQNIAFDFRWAGGEMSFVLVYGDNRQVPFVHQNCYDF
ncbi:hypothetical protein FGADI_8857 [Fusarium gaditjirri]|uniref:Actin-like ATPase domain-containing protein n=1 Tax=Fusarium gaditjirri TaxID=282569 RepID=A0A8H4T1K8_9HYPO|nr:hypothetical protein FGADI_8857 [Fusarium gaditjirri]